MRAYRVNRMMLAVANQVSDVVVEAFHEPLIDAAPEDVPADADLLVVGRQQLRDDGTYRFGYEAIRTMLPRTKPVLLVYTLPDMFSAQRYSTDFDAWQEAREAGVRVRILEVGRLKELRATIVANLRAALTSIHVDVRLLADDQPL